jgi:hypothetical protein
VRPHAARRRDIPGERGPSRLTCLAHELGGGPAWRPDRRGRGWWSDLGSRHGGHTAGLGRRRITGRNGVRCPEPGRAALPAEPAVLVPVGEWVW